MPSDRYGVELILDLHGCDLRDLSEEKLRDYLVRLCDLIGMKRHGEPLFWEDHSGTPHLHGISAVQFIETSNVVIHPLPLLGAVYINVFSCKDFDAKAAEEFTVRFFGAKEVSARVLDRV